MSKYKLDEKIKSCFVSMGMVKEIERYIIRKAKEATGESDDQIKKDFKVIIYDSIGEHELSTLEDYHREKFPNDTKKISIKYDSWGSDNLSIRITFSNKYIWSNLAVEVGGENAKEQALGIKAEIENAINENKNINYIFHGKFNFIMFGVFCASSSVIVLSTSLKQIDLVFVASVLVFVTSLIYYMLEMFVPYCEIETKRNTSLNIGVQWALKGLASVFIFGVIAVYLRKIIFGI